MGHNLTLLGELAVSVWGSSLPRGGVGQGRESPQFLPEIWPYPCWGLDRNSPPQFGGGVAPITAQLL